MSVAYQDFLESKRLVVADAGIEVDADSLHPSLFNFQRDVTRWALRKGRAGIFAAPGLGKTFMQLQWAQSILDTLSKEQNPRCLILAPLAVALQTVSEGLRWGITVQYVRHQKQVPSRGIAITNYEMLEHFDPAKFSAVVLDESGILKDFTSKTRTALIQAFKDTPYRLCCTATPAPNDTAELANHAEFLGVMSRTEMLAAFFVHDDEGWRLRGHAREPFYRWLASWSMSLRAPSDLGYPNDGYALPPLEIVPEILPTDWTPPGQLFATALKGITERAIVRKDTAAVRVARTVELIDAEPDEPWVIWCGLNAEQDALEKLLPVAISIKGTDSPEKKADAAFWFSGAGCICFNPMFRDKLAAWENSQTDIGKPTTARTENGDLLSRPPTNRHIPSNGESTCETGTQTTKSISESIAKPPLSDVMPVVENSTQAILSGRSNSANKSRTGSGTTRISGSLNGSSHSELLPNNTAPSSCSRAEDAASAEQPSATVGAIDSTSITAMSLAESEESSALPVTSDSANSETTPNVLNERRCICGHESGRRYLISKPSIFGFGLNFQASARMAFVGLSDSYEQYYQAIRRCWRFGQTRPVRAHIVLSEPESPIHANVLRKEREAEQTGAELVKHVAEFEKREIRSMRTDGVEYKTDDRSGDNWHLMLGDSAERLIDLPAQSVDLAVFSPPFAYLYVYSPSERDLGNCRSDEEFWQQFHFISKHLLRVMKPGRNVAVHVAQLPLTKQTHGVIGMRDFRGDTIRHFIDAGFIYHGEVCIDKDPQAQAIRTKNKGLLFVQLRKDASWLRPAFADYILVFRTPGENAVPILPDLTNDEWIEWARPIWYGIRESKTLNSAEARGNDDERHIAALQLETIERCVRLWSNRGETVLSPFAGIGSEGVVALQQGRRFVGCELNPRYFQVATKNLAQAERVSVEPDLFSALDEATA